MERDSIQTPSSDDAIYLDVLEEIAEKEETSVLEPSPPMRDVVNVGALGTLLARSAPTDGPITVQFRDAGHRVTVNSEADVTVD